MDYSMKEAIDDSLIQLCIVVCGELSKSLVPNLYSYGEWFYFFNYQENI